MSASSASSTFEPGASNMPSFQRPQAGPWGSTMNSRLERASQLQIPFDEWGYTEAMQNGCLPPPCNPYPVWPPPPGTGFIYPNLQKEEQETLMGEEKGCFRMAAPFVDTDPILPSINPPPTKIGDKEYSPASILNMYNCLSTPQPAPGKCFGYLPNDPRYSSSADSMGVHAGGWLDQAIAPVPTVLETQPLAVGVSVPSQSDSDRNPMKNMHNPLPAFTDMPIRYSNVEASDANLNPESIIPVRPVPVPVIVPVEVPQTSQQNSQPKPQQNSKPQPTPPVREKFTLKAKAANTAAATSTTTADTADEVAVVEVGSCSSDACLAANNPYKNEELYNALANQVDRHSAGHDALDCSRIKPSTLIKCTLNSVHNTLRGMGSCESNQKRPRASRDGQHVYLIIFVLLILITYCTIRVVCEYANLKPTYTTGALQMFWVLVVFLLIYLALPKADKQTEAQKVVCLLIMGIVIWAVLQHRNATTAAATIKR